MSLPALEIGEGLTVIFTVLFLVHVPEEAETVYVVVAVGFAIGLLQLLQLKVAEGLQL